MPGVRRLPFTLSAALALCVAAGCGGGEPDETAAGDAGTETPTAASVKPWRPKKRPPFQPGTAIVVAGERVDIGTPVVLWSDPIGYDGYSERCYSAPYQALPVDLASRPSADPRRYGERSTASLPAAEAKRVREGGWTVEALKRRITQFVVHYDAVGSSERCFRALHDQRGLSVHFMLDLDGTIWQTLDVKERASHAGAANDRSVGVEIANVGAYSTPKFLEPFYGRNAEGRTVNLFPEEKIFGDQRDLSYVAAPWRN
ncbi:MAG TPA: peptidoglycan recognition family protein, partial [Planctomycetota bacterium]|nr:peptidoglycan recognition family protein [Planctomycetota bacterium]